MNETANSLTRRQFLQLAFGAACGLALWRIARVRATMTPPPERHSRAYGSGDYGRGTYGATAVYLPLVIGK